MITETKTGTRRLALALMATVAATALAPLPAAAQSGSNQIVIGQLQFLTNFHPLIQVNNTKRGVIAYGLRQITGWNERLENVCLLCDELPTLDNGLAEIVTNPDGSQGMRVTLRLREGLAWGDGVPVTSADIQLTWEMAVDPKVGFSNYNPWERATALEVVDDRTVILTLPEVMLSYNSWDQIIPDHLERPIWEAAPDAETYVRTTTYNTDPEHPGLWNGPWVVDEYNVGTRIIFERNAHWPGPGPHLDRVILSYRDNSAAIVQNLLAGDITAAPVSPGGISFPQMLELRRQYPTRFTFHSVPGTNLERIALNLDNPILADVRVRRAIVHGIDRQTISDVLFDGVQAVAHNFLSELSPNRNPDVMRYDFDQPRARALLAEAGWTPGPDGICVNAAGERLSFQFGTTAGNVTREQIAQVVQSQLAEVCIETVNQFVPLAEYNGTLARRRQFTGMIMSSIDFPPSASPRIVFASDAIPNEANTFTGNNFSGYANAEMDAAVARAETALDPAEQRAAWQIIESRFAEDLPMIPLYHYARAYVTEPAMVEFESGTLDQLGNWAEHWRRQN